MRSPSIGSQARRLLYPRQARRAATLVACAIAFSSFLQLAPPAASQEPAYRGEVVAFDDWPRHLVVEPPSPVAMVGASWTGHPSAVVEFRVYDGERWTSWLPFAPQEGEGPDSPGSRTRSEPVWTGRVYGIEVRGSSQIAGFRLHFVREDGKVRLPGSGRARAVGAMPDLVTRDAWGARPPNSPPTIAPQLKMAFVHHTATSNDYAPADGPSIVRAIQAYHMDANGWNDIGYNFLIDRYGRIYEGRAGGIDKPVVGAHAQGFNTGSTGIALIGDFRSETPPGAALDAITRLLAWKLPLHGVDPAGQVLMTSGGGPNTRYPAGTIVSLPAISGHRDTGITACPGDQLYGALTSMRREATIRGAAFVPYPSGFAGGLFVAAGDLDGDGIDELVTGAGEGGGPHVRAFASDASNRSSFYAYDPRFDGGVRVAVGRPGPVPKGRIVTAPGPGGGPHVRTFSPDGVPESSFFAYDPGFPGGVYVAVGNVDGLPGDEIVTGAGAGGGPHVRVFKPDGSELIGFYAFDPGFTGGVRVAVGDLDGDGRAEIVTSAGPRGGPHVRIWKLNLGRLEESGGFYAYAPDFQGGVYVAIAQRKESASIVTGAGEGGGLHVRIFTADGTATEGYSILRPDILRGVRVAAGRFEAGDEDALAFGGGPGSFPLTRLQRIDESLLTVGP